ncbi:MAG: hypothetical protein KUG77_15160 [Nannocystaceae bacterium]|nr:hypothetical protein [Nannocystaceae bacterium]
MRTTLSILTLCTSLAACDVPKSVGDESSTTTGSDSSAPDTGSASATTVGTATSATSTTGSGGGVTTSAPTTQGQACPEFDPGPDPDSSLSWECVCATCDLSFPDIPPETLNQFGGGGLCDCLCAEAGCGFSQGEGEVGGGRATATSGWPDTDSTTSGVPDTDSFGETTVGVEELTVGACLDEGGAVVGDPGDGSVFEPDYVCASGDSPLGILDFEPGMPFPKNGGVCCL